MVVIAVFQTNETTEKRSVSLEAVWAYADCGTTVGTVRSKRYHCGRSNQYKLIGLINE